MAVARHGTGMRATFGAVASQVHPVFMLPPIAATWFGAILATDASVWTALLHSIAIFAAVYTAHVKDGYVDFHVRREDEDHPLTRSGCRLCLVLATALFIGAVLLLWWTIDWVAAAITLPTWIIGYFHAPQLDMHPLGATLGYPVGIALALLGGYYVQATTISTVPVAFATVLLVLLAGIKIIDDEQDVAYDRSIRKPTIAVLLGPPSARRLAIVLFAVGLSLVVVLVGIGTFPLGALVAVVVLGSVIAVAVPSTPVTATALLIRGSYVFFAVLMIAVWVDMR